MNTGQITPIAAVVSSIGGGVVGLALGAGLMFGSSGLALPPMLFGLCRPGFLIGWLLESLIDSTVTDVPLMFFVGPALQWGFTGFALYGAVAARSLRLLGCIFLIGVVYILFMLASIYGESQFGHIVGGGLGVGFYFGAGLTVYWYPDRLRHLFGKG